MMKPLLPMKRAWLAMMKLRMNLFALQKTKTADDYFVMNWKILFARLTMSFVELLNCWNP